MRVYLPVALDMLTRWFGRGDIAAPVDGFAAVSVTSDATPANAGADDAAADDEAAEFAAFSAAVAELGATAPRLVVSADCGDASVVWLDERTGQVRVTDPISWSAVAAVHADDPDAAEPDPLGHLLWFAAAEAGDLLARFGADPTIE